MKKLFSLIILALAAVASAANHDHASMGVVGCSDKALLKYFSIQNALASDDLASAQVAAKELQSAGEACSVNGKECCVEMEAAAKGIASANDISTARVSFQALSNNLIATIEEKGLAHGTVMKMHCSMAMNGKGASWIQDNAKVRNPYYGASMLACGSVLASIGEATAVAAGCESCGTAATGACCATK